MQLFDAEGRRLYFTEEERHAFVVAAARAPREVRTFCGTLHATGCRISEALALTTRQHTLPQRFSILGKRQRVSQSVFSVRLMLQAHSFHKPKLLACSDTQT